MMRFVLNNRFWLKGAADITLWVIATPIAFILRLEGDLGNYIESLATLTFILLPVKVGFVLFFGHLKQSWQYASISDLKGLMYSIGCLTFFYQIAAILVGSIPNSIPLIEGILSVILLGGVRFGVRLRYKNKSERKPNTKDLKRVLIVGAGESGSMIVREMLRHPESGLKPIAFLDDAMDKWGKSIMGIPVIGRTTQLCQMASRYKIDQLIIAMPSETGNVIRRIVELANECELPYKTIPSLHDLISGKVKIDQLRDVDVEDLLRRKPVRLNTDAIEDYIRNRRVMVTGAGGSIGSEIVRQIIRFSPESITLLGRGENSIHLIVRELKQMGVSTDIHVKIADVRDRITMNKIFSEIQPEVVFHAAAHKHVPLMEDNPSQAIFNNVGGTRNLVNLALDYDTKYFVNISTDKAVNPTSIMGASKRLAEYIVQRGSELAAPDQTFVSVRFGNVLGSRGSVIPIFKDQIRRGGPVTVTHPEMIRYFMTIPEASQLVLQAGALNLNGAVFVLDMGDPVKIVDMAKDLIRLSGLEPGKDIEIEFTGMRDGEKLYEELLTAEEGTSVTNFEKIMVARKSGLPDGFSNKLELLFSVAENGDVFEIKEMIQSLVPSYSGLKEAEVD